MKIHNQVLFDIHGVVQGQDFSVAEVRVSICDFQMRPCNSNWNIIGFSFLWKFQISMLSKGYEQSSLCVS